MDWQQNAHSLRYNIVPNNSLMVLLCDTIKLCQLGLGESRYEYR